VSAPNVSWCRLWRLRLFGLSWRDSLTSGGTESAGGGLGAHAGCWWPRRGSTPATDEQPEAIAKKMAALPSRLAVARNRRGRADAAGAGLITTLPAMTSFARCLGARSARGGDFWSGPCGSTDLLGAAARGPRAHRASSTRAAVYRGKAGRPARRKFLTAAPSHPCASRRTWLIPPVRRREPSPGHGAAHPSRTELAKVVALSLFVPLLIGHRRQRRLADRLDDQSARLALGEGFASATSCGSFRARGSSARDPARPLARRDRVSRPPPLLWGRPHAGPRPCAFATTILVVCTWANAVGGGGFRSSPRRFGIDPTGDSRPPSSRRWSIASGPGHLTSAFAHLMIGPAPLTRDEGTAQVTWGIALGLANVYARGHTLSPWTFEWGRSSKNPFELSQAWNLVRRRAQDRLVRMAQCDQTFHDRNTQRRRRRRFPTSRVFNPRGEYPARHFFCEKHDGGHRPESSRR